MQNSENRYAGKWLLRTCRHIACIMVTCAIATPVVADPPPWAPAHGHYKNKHKGKNKHNSRNEYDSGVVSMAVTGPYLQGGRCNREAAGNLIGGVVGGVLGSRVGDGDGRKVATVLGAVIGYVVGGSIGRSMDDADQFCTGQALEYGEDRRSVEWKNPDNGQEYSVTPTRTFSTASGYCREFTTESVIGGKTQQVYSTACRQQDGSWKISQ